MQISSNLPPYPNLSTELCHFALLLSTGSIYCEFTASQHCEGQNRYERANTDRTIERHGWFDRSLRNNARASQATDEPGQESSRNYPKTERFRTTPWYHFHHRTDRSEENTSEIQTLMRNSYAVLCLKKTRT